MAEITKQQWREKRTVKQTPEFRLSFPNLFKPQKAMEEGGKDKYNMAMLYPKKTDISVLRKAVGAALMEKWGPKEKWPKNLKLPFKNGDDKADLQGYPGHIVVSASSKQRPAVVGPRKGDDGRFPRIETDEPGDPASIYAGCYCRASVEAIAFEAKNQKGVIVARGVTLQLSSVQKLRDGEPFSGRSAPEDDFEEVEAEEGDISFEDTDGGGDDDLGLD